MKKRTDTERLDWLEKSDADVVQLADGRRALLFGDILGSAPNPTGNTIREVIDSAIRAESRRKK